jgi:hypothetical protein
LREKEGFEPSVGDPAGRHEWWSME